ncbi:trypsin delta-like [Anopheles ziemanni]|uniref:trypsin delta-like n=1 Tax=Anopheles coustani TaxID=139045 RepID=UPI00265B3229|nr:trypsin delta-like [Anopheles coustani]XP_058171469.1 trypsin delta-like [Anopheles ziemanni]
MKLLVLFAFCVVAVVANSELDVWLQYNRRMPGEFYTKGLTARPPFQGRILGGVDADIANYPYQLSLRRVSHSCGASVIAARWALSAAHCTFPVPPVTQITLQGGSSDRTQGGVVFQVEEIINHPNYDDWNLMNDVCVLRTATDLTGVNIAPIALDPASAEHAPGSRAVLSGWGLSSRQPDVLPVILQRVDIPIVSQAECINGWPTGWVTDDMICASEPGRDACNGDSGGPLVVGGQQIGIVSWGDALCVGTNPGVYARVAYPLIRNFIAQETGV